MKYWIYKDSRILGPFEKDAFAGMPGVDSSTLVCAGESAAAGEGDWRPAGDVPELSSLPWDRGPAWPTDDLPSTLGQLDRLQIDAAGLIADDEFPAVAENLFQDADMKSTFSDLLSPRPGVEEAELRRAKDRAAELTVQVEMLYKRLAELEAGQADLMHRLAEKDMLLRGQTPPAVTPPDAPPPAVPPSAVEISGWPAPPPLERPAGLPTLAAAGGTAAPPPAPEKAAPAVTSPAPGPAAPAPAPAPAEGRKKLTFEKKAFKIVPTIKSFKTVGADEPVAASIQPPSVPASAPEPAPQAPAAPAPVALTPQAPAPSAAAPVEPPAPTPAPAPVMPSAPAKPEAAGPASIAPAPAFDWGKAAPPPTAAVPAAPSISLEPIAPAPVTGWPQPAPAPVPTPAPTAVPTPVPTSGPSTDSNPIPAPPATLSFGAVRGGDAAAAPATATPAGSEASAAGPSTQEVLKRLAKPASGPATAAPRPARNNKKVLIVVGVLAILMIGVWFLFLRHPKDLGRMATLDDGRAKMGAEPVDESTRIPMVKPKTAEPAQAPFAPQPPAAQAPVAAAPAAEAPQAASKAALDAAVAAVKSFPLDGDRGTVAQLLQFEYSAVAGAGQESWNASETADKTYLVEYRFTPSARGGKEVHYLFEIDMERGFVIGKNLEAKAILAGGPPAQKPKPKAKKARKPVRKAVARPVEEPTPKEVPLLPLPKEGELRPPAEDSGGFSPDSGNSGL